MDILKRPWIDGEVVAQLKNLLTARKKLYLNAKSKRPGRPKPPEAQITREDSVGLYGELLISRRIANLPPLQIKKWIYYTLTEPPLGSGLQPRFITGELSDKVSSITCEFTPLCVSSFEITEGRRITERSVGNIVQILEYDLVFHGSDGLLFWQNYDYQDQHDSSKTVRKRGKSSKPLPADLRNSQVPDPRFRIHRFKVLSSDESQIFGAPQSLRKRNGLKQLLTTLPRKALVDNELRETPAKRGVKEMAKPHVSAGTDTDDESNFQSQHTSPAKRQSRQGQKARQSSEDEDISQMVFATQIGQFPPPRSGSGHSSASLTTSSGNSEVPDVDRGADWKRRMEDCATDLKRTIQALRNQPMIVKGTKSASKATGGNVGKSPENELLGRSSKSVVPQFEVSSGQSSCSNFAPREGINDLSPRSKKSGRKLGCPKKAIELPSLNTMLHLHPGWQGMKEVTRLDVTIPKGQLTVLETDAAWYPRGVHLAHRNEYPTHGNVTIQSPACSRGSPQSESPALLSPPPNYSGSDSEFSWSPSPVAQNTMPPDSSAIRPSETPAPRRSREYCRRCQDYDITCSSLHFRTGSRCKSCLDVGVSCEYEEAAENVSQRKRGKTHQRVTDDSTEGGEEGAGTGDLRGEVATSAPYSPYADPELDDFSFSTNLSATPTRDNSTSKKPVADTVSVQGVSNSKKPRSNKTCSTNRPRIQRIVPSYEDPEFGDFSVIIIKELANNVSTPQKKDGGIKKRGSGRKLQSKSFASSPELDEFVSTKKSNPKDTNYTRWNANRKESPRGLPSKRVPRHSAPTSADSDTEEETQLMLNPHGMTNVAKFGLLRSQALVYKKEEERKRQERLSLGLPEEEESITDFHVSEPEPYDGYSSSEDKEQERQRKARSITANSSSAHSGLNDAKHNPLSPALNPDGINSPSHQPPDISSHTSPGGKDDRKPKSGRACERPFVVAPVTAYPALAPPTHAQGAPRPNVSEIDSLENLSQAAPASNTNTSSTFSAKSQLVVRDSARTLAGPEPMVLGEHHEDEDGEDEIPQAIPTAYVAPRSSHFVVAPAVQVRETESGKRGIQLQQQEIIGGVATPNGNISSASFELTPRDQVPLPTHVEKDTPIRDPSQPERVGFAMSPGNRQAIREAPFHSTTPQHQVAIIQVRDTPYPLTKSVAYKKHAMTGDFKTLRSGENPAGLRLEDDEIIPGTARDPSSSQSFEVVIPMRQGIKRKNSDGSPIAGGKKGQKRPRVLKLEFGSQEVEFKDLSDLAKEHKKRYLESVGASVKSAESGRVPQSLGGHKNVGMQVPDRQRTLAEKNSVVSPLPPPLRSLSSVNTTIPSPTPIQPPILKPKVSPVLAAQMSESSRRSSTSSAHVRRLREKPPPKLESSTQKALKAIIAAKRESLSGNLTGPISPSNASHRFSSTVSRPPQKVMRPSSSKNTLHCVPPLVSASHSGSLPDQRNPSWPAHPPPKAAQHALQFLGSDDTESDTGVISARPFPPRPQDAQKTLIPTVAAPPPPEEPERIGNYAGITGLDVNVLIPGYNRFSTEKKSKLNDLREAYFGPGKMEMQSPESVMVEEESRQRRIQEFRDRVKVKGPEKKFWWQEDNTPIKSYNRRLEMVKSVREKLERRNEGVTRVELERLSRGAILKNIMKML